ncbi:hypothetical protein FF1_004956 [Malus domestica]
MVEIPEQKLYDGNRFPAVISPTPTPTPAPAAAAAATPRLTETIQANKQYIQDQLRKSGAVLFRGFPVNIASDFNDVVEAFGYEENPYVGTAPRTKIVGRVFTANEAPPDVKIPFHHEMALYPEYPSKLLFFCEVEPVSGGETPIVLSHIVYERMKNKHPQFVQKLEDHGLIYTKIIGHHDDPSSAIGRGWKATFATEDKNIVEQRVSKEGFRLEWLEDGGVKTIKGPILGIKCDSSTGQRKTWFNSIVIAYTEWKGDARNDPEKVVTFGDGSPLAADIIYDCQKILEVESVAIPWRKGDVLLLDNLAVLHSRNPCTTPRRVLAALCNMALTMVEIPEQKLYDGNRFPAVISPTPTPAAAATPRLTETIQANKQYIQDQLLKSGAVLFRGFPVNTASDFNDVVEAFGYEENPYVGTAPRTKIVGRVFTANEAPPDHKIPFHHEMVLYPEYPSKLLFFCEIEPVSGGETPIVLSHIVYERMKDKHPQFVQKLEDHGLIYTKVLGQDYDPSSAMGRGWKSTFGTEDKNIAEQRAAKLGYVLEWLDDGVKTIRGPIPGIKCDSSTRQRKVWFNNIMAVYLGWKDDARNSDPEKALAFGDGSPLAADVIYDCQKILEDESVAIPWRKGDVLLLDNMAVLHSRNPCTTPRRVLASLCK